MMITKIRPKPQRPQYTGQRIHIPGWLTDIDLPAPCFCGQPLMPDQPHIMGEGELGYKRWFHMQCWNMFMNGNDWDDEDEDEDEWES